MDKIPPEVQEFFVQQQRDQRFFETTALAKKNLRQTTATALGVLDKLHQRGVQLETTQEVAETLETSSRVFLLQMPRPLWKRLMFCECLPQWWFKF